MENENQHVYYAFISYKHKANAPWAKGDEKWAKIIHSQLTSWKIPALIGHEQRIKKNDTRIKPIFRDQEEIHAGDNTTNILHKQLDVSRSLIVICSRRMIQEQREKRRKEQKRRNKGGEKAYIFEEIDYFLQQGGKTVILVWIDQTPFNINDPNCIPPQFEESDIKVIEVNSYPKGVMSSRKKQVAAEVAASIFQSNKGLFWDYYKRKRRELILISALIFAIVFGVLFTVWRGRNVNMAYRNTLEAQELLEKGNRYEAMDKVRKAYEAYAPADGLSTAMWKCLDTSQPFISVDGHIEVNTAQHLYAIINKNKQVVLYDTRSGRKVESIDTDYVEQVKFSPDGNLMAFRSLYKTSIYDRKKRCFTLESSIGIKECTDVVFGNNNSKLLYYTKGTASYRIFDIPEGKYLYESMVYSQDSTMWVSTDYSFLNNDSLLLIYGKITSIDRDKWDYSNPDMSKTKWACKLYNTHQKDIKRNFMPSVHSEIPLPENTNCIQVAPCSGRMVVSAQDGIYVYWLKRNGYPNLKMKYPMVFMNWNDKLKAAYQKQYPDWERMKVSNIKFSPNEHFALLTIDDYLRFSIEMSDGWAYGTEYNCTNDYSEEYLDLQRARSIGIGNKQEVVFLNPVELEGHNLAVAMKDDRFGFCRYTHRKPISKLLLDYDVFKDDDLMIVTETDLSYISNFNKSKYVHSYLYLNKNIMGDSVLDGLNQNPDLEVGGVSPSGKYALVENKLIRKATSDNSQVTLWDLEKNVSVCDISSIVGKEISLSCTSPDYLTADEMIVGLYCMAPMKDRPGSRHTSCIIVDLKKQKILFKDVQGASFLYRRSFVSKDILFIDNEGETLIYDIVKEKMLFRFTGECRQLNQDADKIIFEVRIPNQGYTLHALDKQTGRMSSLPFDTKSYGRSYLSASRNGEYLLIIKDKTLQVGSTESGNILYEFPVIQMAQSEPFTFAYFTNDNKYLLYAKESNSSLAMVNLETGKEVYSLEMFNKIIKPTRQSSFLLDGVRNQYWGVAMSNSHFALQSNNLMIFDLYTGRLYADFDLPLSKNAGMCFSPNGKYLLVDNYLIDVEQRQCISKGLKEFPCYLTDKHVVYENDYMPIATSEELYRAILDYDN